MNGGLQAHWQDEWILLRRKWSYWNKLHPKDQIDWEDYYAENRKKIKKSWHKIRILSHFALYLSII